MEENILKVNFELFDTPTAEIISVHICNISLTPGLNTYAKKVILVNMYETYGVRTVNSVIRDFFPEFYQKEIAA